jgi:hypothetical protein
MNTMKLFFGGSPQQARDAYKQWWDQQCGIEMINPPPAIEQEGRGWKVTIWFREAKSS